ncbi:SipW-dependent-type signal peptide-containing protein [Microbacterium sp. p3-SID336]|uniref:SipW-dependent-type signal peptide-containing protein n=1 Tax=Microbacterium sp. p3-SID336 TaxID=2916212 RepID=UPI0021A5FCAA|nr:SipW-dependent-type signal peptide-containing protein [Microbacterium sp. p3-SID336]MCT1478159.1 SipW-dependent-type signal peptide-containing protein [Microbacterium sp. p3-SID336]
MTTRRRMRERRRIRSRRVRAVLAGGLVLGIGATATLAAWNDSEFGTATFTAGRFDIVGAADGATFASHATTGAAAVLNFQLPPTAMAPGTTTYALFSVRTANPSVAGVLQLTAGTPGGTGLAAYLTYGVRTIAGTARSASTYPAGTAVVADGSALTTSGATTQAVAANGGTQVNYCVAVTLPTTAPNAAQGLTMTQTWQIQGTSS